MVALSSMYEELLANNKELLKKLFNLRTIEGMSVAQHINDFNAITIQSPLVKIEFDD